MELGKSALDRAAAGAWSRRRVFVTGATGLLGSWLVAELVERGAAVTCLLRDFVPASRLVGSGMLARTNVVSGDLHDHPLLLRVINEYEIDTVFHLGAQTIVGTARRSPIGTFEANIRGTWNLLEACRICPQLVERIVVASSDKAYGAHEVLPYTEDSALQGRFPYDVSKSCADLIAQSYHATFETPVAITRCGNIWGPGDLNYNRLIPGTIRSALLGESPVIRSDGTFRRDYVYVRDAVDAYLTLADRMTDAGVAGQAFNFGPESPMSVLEVTQAILERVGKPWLRPTILNGAQNEIRGQYLDSSKARRLLNWRPRYSFEEGLDETIAWYAQQMAQGSGRAPELSDGAEPVSLDSEIPGISAV